MNKKYLIQTFICIVFSLFISGCSKIFYQPDHVYYYPPEKAGYSPEEYYFDSIDKTKIHAWKFNAKLKNGEKPLGTIIQFHGNAQNITSHYISLVWLTKIGYDLFIFDYRGYGRSDGIPTQEAVYQDGMVALDKAWDWHVNRKSKKFIVYGQSLGGAIALRSFADFRNQDKTDLVVVDSSFASYKSTAQSWLAKFWVTWLFSPLAQLLVSDDYAPKKIIERIHSRVLVIHDLKDPIVIYKNGKEVFDKLKTEKELWELNDGGHVAIFFVDSENRRKKFADYLQKL